MAFDSLPILRREIYRAGQSYFQYELNKEEQDACLSKFQALDGNGDQKVSQQELRDNCGIMDSSVAARVCRFFELVDGNGNGFLDFDECKALFFLFNKARVCDGCEGLIIHGGLSCLHCLPYHYFDFCCYCVHHQQRHQHYQHRFEALPALINGSSLQEKLPPVMPPPAFLQQQQQHYHHSHGFQSFPPLVSSNPQVELPSDHQAIAPSHQDNARSGTRGLMQTAGNAAAVLGHVATIAVAINSCSIM